MQIDDFYQCPIARLPEEFNRRLSQLNYDLTQYQNDELVTQFIDAGKKLF